MRLNDRTKEILLDAVEKSFGKVDVYLFGSRVDDKKKGGDIDLALDIDISKEQMRKKKARFFVELPKKDLDIPVDLVSKQTKDELLQKELQNAIHLNPEI